MFLNEALLSGTYIFLMKTHQTLKHNYNSIFSHSNKKHRQYKHYEARVIVDIFFEGKPEIGGWRDESRNSLTNKKCRERLPGLSFAAETTGARGVVNDNFRPTGQMREGILAFVLLEVKCGNSLHIQCLQSVLLDIIL